MLPRSLERLPSPSSSLAASGLLFSEMVPDWMGPGGVLSLFTRCLLAPRAGTLPWITGKARVSEAAQGHTCLSLPACLYFICKALEKDCCYSKGLVLKEKIFQEQPCLRQDSLRMFLKW